MSDAAILDRVYEVIRERERLRPEASYVVSLLDGGHDAIAAKVREEAAELIDAARDRDLDHAAHEAADLLFHTLVLMASIDLPPATIPRVLHDLRLEFSVRPVCLGPRPER